MTHLEIMLSLITYTLMAIMVGRKVLDRMESFSPDSHFNEIPAIFCGIFWPVIVGIRIFYFVFISDWKQ